MFGFFKNRKRVITDRTGQIPYLIRWYVFLKDRKDFPFNITLHKVLVSDEPTLHDRLGTGVHLLLKVDIGNTFVYNETTGGVVGSSLEFGVVLSH